jgi:flagellar hook assembly protein FlgD
MITYAPAESARVSLKITYGNSGQTVFKIMDGVPHVAGTYIFNWDGRYQSTKILPDNGQVTASCTVDTLLRENHIITTGNTPKISMVRTDPYRIDLVYGQFTRITYNLSRDANVTIRLISPSSPTLTVVNGQQQTVGEHAIEWSGLDATDSTGKKLQLSGEGTFTVSIQATNPVTGASSEARGCLQLRN